MDQFPSRTPKDARAHIKKTVGDFRDFIRHRIVELKLSTSDKAKFLALLGETKLEGELRHSNLRAWEQFAKLVISEVRDLERSKDLDFFHVTLLADEGIRSDRRPYIPLDPLRRKIDKSLRKAGVDGIYRMEVSPLMNWPQKGKGRTLLCHGHALIWTEKGAYNERTLISALQMGPRGKAPWTSKFGAIPVFVRPITPHMGSASYWAAYILKMPHEALNRRKRKTDEADHPDHYQRYRMMSTKQGYRPEFAMLLFEMFCQLGLYATVSGVGVGAEILRRCRARCAERMKRHYAGKNETPAFNVKALMRKTHKFRRRRYHPYFIDGRTLD